MMKINSFLKIFFHVALSALYSDPSIVFVHLGPRFPPYLSDAICQAREFNECPIYLIANQAALIDLPREVLDARAICVSAESFQREPNHQMFCRLTRLDKFSRGGFWLYATERFFYLYEFMKEYGLSDVIHLESDNALYADVSTLLPVFQKYYPDKIAGTFDNDSRCIAGFLYISNSSPLRRFLQFVMEKIRTSNNDMEFLAQFKQVDSGSWIEQLPILPPSYAADHPLLSAYGHAVGDPQLYFHHFEAFRTVFDAAAIGQYLGGIDPRNDASGPGFINESAVFNPSHFQYDWVADPFGRLIPFLVYHNERWPIVNLHIHSKNLKPFKSRRFQI